VDVKAPHSLFVVLDVPERIAHDIRIEIDIELYSSRLRAGPKHAQTSAMSKASNSAPGRHVASRRYEQVAGEDPQDYPFQVLIDIDQTLAK
jgi:hypothetical protein